ncbi:MAG TPA: DUF1688 family protein [Polyangiaceae bacterium]|nr:DUF1688 family protein [Polyangiaceae bacterium]
MREAGAPADVPAALAFLRTPAAVRERCGRLFALGLAGGLPSFEVRPAELDRVAEYVARVTRERFPALAARAHGRFGHFDAGGVGRAAELDARLAGLPPDERARTKLDLVVPSVLLDAGAGPAWAYRERESGASFARSEGLAVATYRMFLAGAFSSDPARAPLRADGAALAAFDDGALARGLQVDASNPLVGLGGRLASLRGLGRALAARPDLFGERPRIGGLFDALRARAEAGRVRAGALLALVLEGLAGAWPAGAALGGQGLGDVWPHPALGPPGPRGEHLVPFHKLAQWLVYSLVEPLREGGLEVTGLHELTALAEYRNGGLLVDLGALVPRDPDEAFGRAHAPGSPLVVEWRALTVALLDRLAPLVRARLGATGASSPLAGVLEGGTWAAGRRAAEERRQGGHPPIRIESDGAVF